MKQRHLWLAGVGIIVAMFTFIACQDDKEEDTLSYPTALVTVKPNLGNTAFTLQLDDSLSLTPSNMKFSPFGMKEMRALVNYNVVDGPAVKEGKDRVKGTTYVNINWLNSIRRFIIGIFSTDFRFAAHMRTVGFMQLSTFRENIPKKEEDKREEKP